MSDEALATALQDGILNGAFDALEVEACTESNLEDLKKVVPSHEIPKTYESFLRQCGRRLSYFQPVLTFFYGGILRKNVSFFSEESAKNGLFARFISSGVDRDILLAGIVVAADSDDKIYLLLPEGSEFQLFEATTSGLFQIQKSELDFNSLVLNWYQIFLYNHENLIQSHPAFFALIKDFRSRFLNFYHKKLIPHAIRNQGHAIRVMNAYDRVLTKLYRAIEEPSRQIPSIQYDLGMIDLLSLDNLADSAAIVGEGNDICSFFLEGVNSYWESNPSEWISN